MLVLGESLGQNVGDIIADGVVEDRVKFHSLLTQEGKFLLKRGDVGLIDTHQLVVLGRGVVASRFRLLLLLEFRDVFDNLLWNNFGKNNNEKSFGKTVSQRSVYKFPDVLRQCCVLIYLSDTGMSG